jgi:hypothetical protein
MRDVTMYVIPFLSNAQYISGTGREVWEAMYCMVVASESRWNGPYLRHTLRVRNSADDARGRKRFKVATAVRVRWRRFQESLVWPYTRVVSGRGHRLGTAPFAKLLVPISHHLGEKPSKVTRRSCHVEVCCIQLLSDRRPFPIMFAVLSTFVSLCFYASATTARSDEQIFVAPAGGGAVSVSIVVVFNAPVPSRVGCPALTSISKCPPVSAPTNVRDAVMSNSATPHGQG